MGRLTAKGVNHTIKPFIEGMYERQAGSIVCISSISGDRGNAGQTNYAATKAAVIGLVKSLAREAARYNIRANAIAPGFINTEMTLAIPDKVCEFEEAFVKTTDVSINEVQTFDKSFQETEFYITDDGKRK